MKQSKISVFFFGCVMALSLRVDANQPSVFSFPIQQDTKLTPANKPTTVTSQAFLFETTGKALKRGITIPLTAPGALMLVSSAPDADTDQPLDAQQLLLTDARGASMSAKTYSEPQMAQTGLFSRSIALKSSPKVSKGPVQLRTSQALPDDARFVIRVKEPNSSVSLTINARGQSVNPHNKHLASMSLTSSTNDDGLALESYSATLVSPDGTSIPVNANRVNNEVMFALPENLAYLAPKKGLYELKVQTHGKLGALAVKRNAKLAIAAPQPTAKLTSAVLLPLDSPTALIQFQVMTPARFEIRAVLYGTGQDGKLKPVMETHAAQYLNTGLARMSVPFDEQILFSSRLGEPYAIGMVRLFDQGQLGLLGELHTDYPVVSNHSDRNMH